MQRIECPNCGNKLKYADEHAGKKAKCQKCGASFRLPIPTEGTAGESHGRHEPAQTGLPSLRPGSNDHRGTDLSALVDELQSGYASGADVWHISHALSPDAMQALLEAARRGPPTLRLLAAIGQCPCPAQETAEDAAGTLAGLLGKSEDRRSLLKTLVKVGYLRNTQVLEPLLKSADWPDRALAMLALGRSRSESAVPALVQALKGKIAGPPSTDPRPQTSDWGWLAEEFALAFPKREGLVDVPLLATWALGENRHAAAIPALQQILDTRMANDRVFARSAVVALATIQGEAVADSLLRLAKHKRGAVRFAAVWAMGRLDAQRYRGDLRAALADRDSSVRLAAARALARSGSQEGASIVLKTMSGWFTAADLREEAFEAADDMLLLEALPSLGNWICQTSDRKLRQTAGVALAHILAKTPDEKVTAATRDQGQSPSSLLRQVNALFELEIEGAGRAAARLIAAGCEDLVHRLEKSGEDRWFSSASPQAIRALRAAGKGGDASVWMKRLMHKNEEIAEGAAYALYNIGDKACEANLLKEALHNQNHRRRMYAIIALGGCGTPRVFEQLKPLVRGSDGQVAVCAGMALVETGVRHLDASLAAGIPAVLETLWSVESFAVRAALVQYFAQAGYRQIVPKAVDEMRNTYGDGPFAAYRGVMARALGRLKDESAATALAEAALGDPNLSVADTASHAYGNVTGR